MFSTGISRFNFRMAAFVGSLALSVLGCGRADKRDVAAMQAVPYSVALKECPDKVNDALRRNETFSNNGMVSFTTPFIRYVNKNALLLFPEDSLCIPVKPEPKVVPTSSAPVIASAPVPTTSASAAASVAPTVSAHPSSTAKIIPSSTGPIKTAPTTTGGFRPQ